jgi:CheY-like chemotaxis protein
MALTSLLVCADAEAIQVLSRIFHDLGIEVETCGDPHTAKARIEERRFDAMVVDCQDESAAAALIARIRSSPFNRQGIIIALVNRRNQVPDIFEHGANFLLYKPLSRERALHSLYAARGLLREERRTKPRIPVHASASLAYPGKEDAAATVIELNDSGLGIRTTAQLPPNGKVYFEFSLPGEESIVRLAGEVIWRDASGRVGVRFVNVPQASKRVLQKWLQEQSASSPDEPSTSSAAQENKISVRLSAGLGLLSASAPDRRNPSRRPCRLGAEVYPAESKVPHRCTLSDISDGGCYVETTEPFPQGTILTIVVRTHELKLCVAGKVQSMHPGFGMGVRFNLTTDDDRGQVQELIACAEAQTKLST